METVTSNRIKYYSVAEVVAMLPYLYSYCRDFQKLFKKLKLLQHRKTVLSDLITTSLAKTKKIKRAIETIDLRIHFGLNRYKRWKKELDQMNIRLCSTKLGRVDVPIWDDATNSVVYLCISTLSAENELEWHTLDRTYKSCRKFWGI